MRKKVWSMVLSVSLAVSGIFAALPAQAAEPPKEPESRKVGYTLHVSPDGKDTGDGSTGNPYRTIDAARRAVRALRKDQGDIVVKIADGFYQLDETVVFGPEDSGNENCMISYEPEEGATPVISGGEQIEGTWKNEGNGIYSIDYDRDTKLRSLYVNGERAYMTKKTLTGLGGYGSYPVTAGQAEWAWISGSVFEGTKLEKGSIPMDTPNPEDIELQTTTTWNTATVCVESLEDIGNNQIAARLQMPYGAIAQQPGWGNAYKLSGSQIVYNVFEWLKNPGEFYFDKTKKKLYYIPREGESMESAFVVVPELETLFKIQGNRRENRVKYLSVSGLTFAYTDWNLYEVDGSAGRATVQGAAGIISFSEPNWHNSIYRAYDVGPGAVMASNAEQLALSGNTICHTGNDGLSLVNDVVDSRTDGNVIYDLAGSGLLIGHPQHAYIDDKGSSKGKFADKEKYEVGVEGSCKNLTVTNNFISDTSRIFWGDAGIMVFHGSELDLEYNHLQNTPYTGLSLGWGWWNMNGTAGSVVPGEPSVTTRNNTVKHNIFRDTITDLGDGGAIYTLGDMPGSVINENYIWSIGTPGTMPYHIRGIHADEGTQHLHGEYNLIEIRNDLTCVDCGNWGEKGNNTWDNNYSTTSSYTTTGSYEPGTVITNKHVSPEGIWGKEVFEIVKQAGVNSGYYSRIPAELLRLQDVLLPTGFYMAPGEALDLGLAEASVDGELWLAPEGTKEFVQGEQTVRLTGGKGNVPARTGSYKLYMVKGNSVSSPSAGSILIQEGSLVRNITDGGSYRTSEAEPLTVELYESYVQSAVLDGKTVTSGFQVKNEGSHELTVTDLSGNEDTIHFTTYIEAADKVFPANAVAAPGEHVAVRASGDPDLVPWFVPEDLAVTDISQFTEGDSMTKADAGNAFALKAPKLQGKYRLYLVGKDTFTGPSAAVLTVASDDIGVTDGLLVRFQAETLEAEENAPVAEWEDTTGQYLLAQKDPSSQPLFGKTDLGMAYLRFDGSDDGLVLKDGQSIDLNGKSNLSIVALSAYEGEEPDGGTYGDYKTTLYFGESGGWGSIYLSSYSGMIVTRFGTGQGNNFVKYNRPQATRDFVMTAMVKDKGTEYLYENGEKVMEADGKQEKTANNKTVLNVGVTPAGKTTYFAGKISEILIYDRTLSDEEIRMISRYMNQKLYLGELNPQIGEAQAVLTEEGAEKKYAAASWENLQLAYGKAIAVKEQVMSGETVQKEEIRNASEALKKALEALASAITEIPDEGLSLWLKADTGVVLGEDGRIETWKDSSGKGNHAVIAQNAQPGETLTAPVLAEDACNGKAAVRFNGSSDGLQFPFGGMDGEKEGTVVLVSACRSDNIKVDSGDNMPLLYFHESGGWGKFVVTPTQTAIHVRFGSGSAADGGGNVTYQREESVGEAFTTTVVTKSGPEESIYVGDQLVLEKKDGAQAFTNIKDDIGYLGRYPSGQNREYWYNPSDVAEVMIFNRTLALAEIQQIYAYIKEKYAAPAAVLESIEAVPDRTEYNVGEPLNLAGLVVTARYSDGSLRILGADEYTVSGYDSEKAGTKEVTVSYTEGGVTKEAVFTVKVAEEDKPDETETETEKESEKETEKQTEKETEKPTEKKPTPGTKVKVKKVSLKSAKKLKNGKIKAVWTKMKNIDGYELQYASNKSFKKAVKKNIKKKYTSYSIRRMKNKKYIYIRIRAYKKVNRKKVYGPYSRKIRVKL